MDLIIKKLNPLAMQIGGVYRVVGKYHEIRINCLAVCIKANDEYAEYITIKDYDAFSFKCHGDIFRVNINNCNEFTTFTKINPNELRVYPL